MKNLESVFYMHLKNDGTAYVSYDSSPENLAKMLDTFSDEDPNLRVAVLYAAGKILKREEHPLYTEFIKEVKARTI